MGFRTTTHHNLHVWWVLLQVIHAEVTLGKGRGDVPSMPNESVGRFTFVSNLGKSEGFMIAIKGLGSFCNRIWENAYTNNRLRIHDKEGPGELIERDFETSYTINEGKQCEIWYQGDRFFPFSKYLILSLSSKQNLNEKEARSYLPTFQVSIFHSRNLPPHYHPNNCAILSSDHKRMFVTERAWFRQIEDE